MVQEFFRSDMSPSPEFVANKDGLRDPDPHMQISYVIPIRGEIGNGNFFKQMRNLSNQVGIGTDAFEVIYVRNNPANKPSVHERFRGENTTILESIRFIQGVRDELPEELEEWQRTIVTDAKEKKLHVNTMEIETDSLVGKVHFGDYIDGSRIVGENEAVERFRSLDRNGAVVTIDADTRIGADTTVKIKEQLLDDPEAEILRMDYDYQFIPGEGGVDLFRSSPTKRFSRLMFNIRQTLDGRVSRGWYAVKSESLGIRTTQGSSLAGARDHLLEYSDHVKPSVGIRMTVQDRARADGVGGDDSRLRLKYLVNLPSGVAVSEFDFHHPVFTFLTAIYQNNIGNESLRRGVADQVKKYFEGGSWHLPLVARIEVGLSITDEMSWRGRISEKLTIPQVASIMYEILSDLSGDKAEDLAQTVTAKLQEEQARHEIHRSAIHSAVVKAFEPQFEVGHSFAVEEVQSEPGQTEEAHFIGMNTWLLDELNARRSYGGSTYERATGVIYEKFPEYAKPFEETEIMRSNAVLAGIKNFLEATPNLFAA